MDEYEHLTDTQWQLYDLMSQISEDCFCAGWADNCEYDIWQALQHTDPWAPNHPMSPRLLRLCRKLSTEIDGWIYWVNEPQFAPMARWQAMVEEKHERAAQLKQMREAQAMIRQCVPAEVSLADEIIADRHFENAGEDTP